MVRALQVARGLHARHDFCRATGLAAKRHVVGIAQHQMRLVAGWHCRIDGHAPFRCGTRARHIGISRAGDAQHRLREARKRILRVARHRQGGRERNKRRQPRFLHAVKAQVALPGNAQCGVGTKRMAAHADAVSPHILPAHLACHIARHVARCLAPPDLTQHKPHVVQARQQLGGRGRLAQRLLVGEGVCHTAHGGQVAAGMLQVHHHKTGSGPGPAPDFATVGGAPQAVREKHYRK